jgi:cleavage and polyadenylation specificity factor subunit 1
MVDESSLGLRLEHCTFQQIGENGDMLMVLSSGDLAIVSFDLEGRTVSGIKVHKVSNERGGQLLSSGVSSASILSRTRVFLGSEDSDAVILGWSSTQKQPTLTRKRSHAEMLEEDEDVELDDLEDEDDIYGADDAAKQQRRGSAQEAVSAADYTFRVHDKLPNYVPIGPMTLGVPPTTSKSGDTSESVTELEMVYPCGRSTGGGLAVLRREIDPVVLLKPDLPKTKAIWGVRPAYDLSATADFHEYVVAVQSNDEGEDQSVLYKINDGKLEVCEKDEFEPEAGTTIEMGTLAGGKKIVQVLKDQVKVYDESKLIRPRTQFIIVTIRKTSIFPALGTRSKTLSKEGLFAICNEQLLALHEQHDQPADNAGEGDDKDKFGSMYLSYSNGTILLNNACLLAILLFSALPHCQHLYRRYTH